MAPFARALLPLALCLLAACGGPPMAESSAPPLVRDMPSSAARPPADSAKPAANPDCPRLQSALADLLASDDPAAQARVLGASLEGGRLLVMVTIAPADVGRLSQYDAEVSGQSGDQAQALVPLDRLCALANDPAVLAVRLPASMILERP